MKKIMFGLAAAIAMVAAADIVSANVVGYLNKTAAEGFTQITPAFDKCDGSVTKAADIKGAFAEFDGIQIFDKDGNVETELLYLNDSAPGVAGWYNGDMEYCGDVVIAKGAELWLSCQASVAFTMEGQVPTVDVTKTMIEGFNAVGNSTPVDLKVSEFAFTGLSEFDGIQIFDKDGNVATELLYLDDSAPGDAGWYNGDMEYCGDVVIPAGSGFWVSCQSGGATVKIPAPVVK